MNNKLLIAFCLVTALSAHMTESRADSILESEKDYADKRLLMMDKILRSKTTAEIIALEGRPLDVCSVDKRIAGEVESFSPQDLDEQCTADKYLKYQLTENRYVGVFIKNDKCTCVKNLVVLKHNRTTRSNNFKVEPPSILRMIRENQEGSAKTLAK